jgi:hypothetical protein
MTDMLDRPTLPKSVADYLSDSATRAGVEALLAVEADTLPPEIEWDELGDYLAARAVAELTRAEFALAMHTLWQSIWGRLVSATWDAQNPERMDEEGQAVSTGAIWNEKAFTLFHKRDGATLYTLVGLHRRKLTIAFSLERRDRAQIKSDVDGFTWRDDTQWAAWMLAEGLAPSGNNNPDLSSLQVAAERAMTAVEAIPKPAKRPVNAKPKPKASRSRP